MRFLTHLSSVIWCLNRFRISVCAVYATREQPLDGILTFGTLQNLQTAPRTSWYKCFYKDKTVAVFRTVDFWGIFSSLSFHFSPDEPAAKQCLGEDISAPKTALVGRLYFWKCPELLGWSFHLPSIHFLYLLVKIQGRWEGGGASPCSHRARGRVHPGRGRPSITGPHRDKQEKQQHPLLGSS